MTKNENFFFLQSWELKNAWRRTRKYAMFSMWRQINTLGFYTLVYVTSRGYDTDPYVQEKNRQWWFIFFFPNSRTMVQLVKSGITLTWKEAFSTKHRINYGIHLAHKVLEIKSINVSKINENFKWKRVVY